MNDKNPHDPSDEINKTTANDESKLPQNEELKKVNNDTINETQITLTDTKNHNKSNVIKYIVQDGETLHNISAKFSIPKKLIKSSNQLGDNHVHPGDTLKIYLDVQSLDEIGPINVSLYDSQGKSNHVKGRLYIKNYNLVFHPQSIAHHQLKINLFGHLEPSIIVNPDPEYLKYNHHHHHHHHLGESGDDLDENPEIMDPTTHSVLSIEFLNDQNQLVTEYFTGDKEDIEKYHSQLSKISKMTKETPEEYHPDQICDAMNSKSFIMKQRVHHNSISYHSSQKLSKKDDDKPQPQPAPHIVPLPEPALINISINTTSDILKDENILAIRKQLSKMYRNSDWKCLFKRKLYGFSLSTLFSKTHNQHPLVLVIKTTENEIIGVFIPCELVMTDKYYGNGEVFIFRFQPEFEIFRWDLRKPTCNRYFIYSSLESIYFGASNEEGEGSALYIDNSINHGFSEACDTYCSPQLTSQKKFHIEELEIWGIGFNPEF
ncbi:hypothetical protein M9Y10_028421 [Tritrichomonas musculus]|uniref:Oxidation resistance protein 1 n=1 Tax=Tritrichomonas musculus TaxID=1915356 RepID=A0ABR2KJH7_9EUKA